jgi:hypothetical protein
VICKILRSRANAPCKCVLFNWYIAKFFQAAQYDGVLATKFLEVANLMEQPAALMSLGITLRAVRQSDAQQH